MKYWEHILEIFKIFDFLFLGVKQKLNYQAFMKYTKDEISKGVWT